MTELDSIDALAVALGVDGASSLVAVDGIDGAGKTYLSCRLARLLGWPVVHLDDFVKREQDGFLEHIDYAALATALTARPVIVEGVLVLDVLHRLSLDLGCLIYVKRVSDYGLWYDEELCDPQEPVDELIARIEGQLNQFTRYEAQIERKPGPALVGLSPFRQEVIRYHARVRPFSRAHYVFLSQAPG